MVATMKRSPVRLDGIHVSELGRLLEVKLTNGTKYLFDRRNYLVWSPEQNALISFATGAVKKGRRTKNYTPGAAAKAWRKWADTDDVEWERSDKFNEPSTWQRLGAVQQVDYWSDKYTNATWLPAAERGPEFYHPIDSRPPTLYIGKAGRNPVVYAIRGGDLRLTAHGLEG